MKKILFIFSGSPSNTNAQEGFEALLAGSAFTECEILFREEAVLQLKRGQDADAMKRKDYSRGYGALKDYGVSGIYCSGTALKKYLLEPEDLLINVDIINSEEERIRISESDLVLSYK